ncbi:hypothetical protein C8Q74DRAFT_1050179 [Fomes fomentarius]|nr:hypothetical protein C8Q74DRAFT_1050179 [Fomes fomentarius]
MTYATSEMNMPQGAPTLLYRTRIPEPHWQQWTGAEPEYPGNTKDCKTAAAPGVYNNYNPPKMPHLSYNTAQERTDAGPSTLSNFPLIPLSTGPHMSLQHAPAVPSEMELLHPSLPQRPEGVVLHKRVFTQPTAETMKPEICRRYLHGRCWKGQNCPRIHPNANGQIKPSASTQNSVASTSATPIESLPHASTPHTAALQHEDARSLPCDLPQDAAVSVEPPRPARAIEEDTRPARVGPSRTM